MRRTFVVASLLLAAFASAPAVAAESGEVSTGEVDTYGTLGVGACPQVISTWQITLTLEDPATTDVVTLTAQGQVTTVVDVATGVKPTATVIVHNNHGCQPLTQVTGVFVDGSVSYTLDYTRL